MAEEAAPSAVVETLGATADVPKVPSEEERAEIAMTVRVNRVIDVFANEEAGVKTIPLDDVGSVIRACGVYLPELILVDQILPAILEDEYAELEVVRVEPLQKKILTMLKERTWEADTEHELLLAFRKLDQLAHNGSEGWRQRHLRQILTRPPPGEELGFIESDKMSKFMTSQGTGPFSKAENDNFLAFAQDATGSKIFYHDYIGKLVGIIENEDYTFSHAHQPRARKTKK